ncbi:MAG: hypothetical protein NTU79_06380 [Planctomycetota bacterium]|nr:hypothetical protein [Planctomycetota bacterium]
MAVEQIVLSGAGASGIAGHLLGLGLTESTTSPVTVKFGRIRPLVVPQVLALTAYFDPSNITPPPTTVDYATKAAASLGNAYLNNAYSNCVIAGKYHAEGVWSGNDSDSGGVVVATNQEVLTAYQTICGPGDHGCVITQVLNYYRDHGLKFNGSTRKIDGYVRMDWTNKLEVQVAIYLFGAVTIGINFPSAWQNNSVWDVTDSLILNGHDVTCVGYDTQGVQVSSWGRIYTITWAAFLATKWIDEAYVMLSPDWYGNDKLAPSGINASGLQADLQKIGQGVIPSIDPAPSPPITNVFSNGGDVLYAIRSDWKLLWYRHLGNHDGTFSWLGPKEIGHGWNFRQVFSGGGGIIYGITNDSQLRLRWYRHVGYGDGTSNWYGPIEVGHGWDYRQIFSGGGGIIYGITNDSQRKLHWWRHVGYGDGSFNWIGPNEVGHGWDYRQIFSGGGGIIYGITNDSQRKLHWWRHVGYGNGSFNWIGPNEVGHGWGP